MKDKTEVLVVGATGYLGLHIVDELTRRNTPFKALARNKVKLLKHGIAENHIVTAEVTKPESLNGVCDGVTTVISCLGITRQRDGLSYADVDYQANLNVLQEAERSGVKQFIYVSAFNADKYPEVRLLGAKEHFAQRLLSSRIPEPKVIRPNGFFSDLEAIYHMASKGKAYVFGQGAVRLNPIHGQDLARFCIEVMDINQREFAVGGPEVLSNREIAELAFHVQNKKANIIGLPDWIRKLVLILAKRLPEKWGGPVEFFLTMLQKDAIAPCYGQHTLGQHYAQCCQDEVN